MNLKTIAQKAGVSTATVSNVINGNFHKVSQATREKIEAIIEETDYKPNAMARSLAMKESRIIGLVVPYVRQQDDFLSNPYYAHIIAAFERIVRSRDYYLMIRCVDNCGDILPLLSSWNVDGAIFLGVGESDVQEICDNLTAPKVFLDTYNSKSLPIANVGIDDYRGGYLSARYLIGKGHRKIALVCPEFDEDAGVIPERFHGFCDACKERQIDFDPKEDVFISENKYRNAVDIGQNIAFSGGDYTAVAVLSDVAALGVIEGLTQGGIRVPDEISVIGFDNLPECEFVRPKLTTIAQDFVLKAEQAGEILFDMIQNGTTRQIDERQPISVVERQSVRELSQS